MHTANNMVQNLKQEVRVEIQKFKSQLRRKVRRKNIGPNTDPKMFWKMSRLKDVSDNVIHAFKTQKGDLVMEQDEMLSEIEKEVTDMFSASKEPVFGSRREQECLSQKTEDDLNLPTVQGLDFSDEVFPPFTIPEVEKLVNDLRDGRAPGYDHIIKKWW